MATMSRLFAESDEKIMELVYSTHVHEVDRTAFDSESMFFVAQNIINYSTQAVDAIVLGNQVQAETVHTKAPKASFISPLCTLKSISTELCCKPPGEDLAHSSTLAILGKLSGYSWETEAVLALAAFALDYGDFWLLARHRETDELAKSLAILRRVPILLLKPGEQPKRRRAVSEVSELIKATLQVIELIYEFDKLSTSYDPKDVPGLAKVMDHFPVDVYWAILSVAACSTNINILTSQEEKPHDLTPYAQKIHYTLNKLKIQLTTCNKQIEEAENYRKLRKLFQTPTEIMEIFKALTFSKDGQQPIIDGSTNKPVATDVLRKKNVLWFISSLGLTDEDIAVLRPIYAETKKDSQYKIVWIPIVENWTDELRERFAALRSKMPWCSVQYFSPVAAATKFIKEEWHFKGKPMVVAMNPQGKVDNYDALPLIRVWGKTAFPFDKAAEERISKEKHWIGPVGTNIDPSIDAWIQEEKYIFFYGGKDSEWIKQFAKKVTVLLNDPIIKAEKIPIEPFCVGKNLKGEEDFTIFGAFWSGIESLFLTKAHREVDPATREVQRLLSYKNESGWAVLSKGSAVVASGQGSTVLRAVEEVEKWKEFVKEKGYEVAFKEYLNKASAQSARPCCRVDIPSVAGKVPEAIRCPDCPRDMATFVSFKCCHIDGPASAHH